MQIIEIAQEKTNMAILKHIASKNADYGETERYLIFQHDEYTQKPILDENGNMLLREEYYLDGINCDPFTFDAECRETNAFFHKNQSFNEIKSHHYIISFDPKDQEEHGLTGEQAQKLGVEYARENFPGHQALVCTHTDGHNGSGNIHVHIVINSVRKYNTEPQPYMEFDRDSKAGYKHHLSDRYSYLHPNRQKYITGRNLGTLYEENHLMQVFQENSNRQHAEKSHSTDRPVTDFSEQSKSSASVQTDETTHSFLFIKSDLRLVTDLQHCIKTQQSQAYAQKVKLSNLKMMAQTVAYVQEHGFQSKEDLDTALSNASAQSTDARNTLKSTEDALKNINEQIHYTGQYLANKSIYSDYRKSRNKEKFYDDHRAELTLYESALRILREKSQGQKLPTLKMLREEKNRLTKLQTVQRDEFNTRREYERELRTVCSNVNIILRHPHIQETLHETSQGHSYFR